MEEIKRLHGIIKELELAGAWYTAALIHQEMLKLIKELVCEQSE